MIDLREVLAIDGGLSYIFSIYPDARGCETGKKKFSLRGEKTPSAALKKMTDGTWIVTDFGGDSKGRNAIKLAMLEKGLVFKDALHDVAGFYNFEEVQLQQNKADYNEWPAKPDEQEGETYYKVKELEAHDIHVVLTDSAYKALSPDDSLRFQKAKDLFALYRFKALEYYRFVKDGVTHEYKSNERFPILLIDEGEFGKIYVPKAPKKYRFRYIGKKPTGYFHGLKQHKDFVRQAKIDADAEYESLSETEKETKRKEDKRFKDIILCSGGSDALNAAAFGYRVIWRNSETETFLQSQYNEILDVAKELINLPDIDETGVREGHKLALQFLEMKTAWLPNEILEDRGQDGKPLSKDLRDWLRYPAKGLDRNNGKHEFDSLIRTALCYQFWDVEPKTTKEGKFIFKFGRQILDYRPNNLRIYNFLYRNGFGRYRTEAQKEGYMYVHAEKGIVREVEWNDIKQFINDFLAERNETEDLRNTFYRTPYLSESSFSNLPLVNLDFEYYGPDFQYFFFNKIAWKITPTVIEETQQSSSGKMVWQEKVLKVPNDKKETFKPKLLPNPAFTISKKEDGEFDITVHHQDCSFLNFIIQTSRVFWRRELEERLRFPEIFDTEAKQTKYQLENGLEDVDIKELKSITYDKQEAYLKKYRFAIDGEFLTEEEIAVQKKHLINKIFCIGFALHRFKFRNRPWAVWTMDNKLSDDGEAHGGAGKSILTFGIKMFLKTFLLPGQQLDQGKMEFIFDGMSSEHDLVLSDDTSQYVNFKYFYEHLSSDMVVARKGLKAMTIPFKDSPKFWFNSNFGDRFTEPSDMRRKIYMVFSDYYHKNTGEYLETREPKDDFGKQLFDDWSFDEWNSFYNTMARCLQFYLSCTDKIDVPEGNVEKRNLISIMGESFRAWADTYFAEEGVRLNAMVSRTEAQEAYNNYNKGRITPQSFMKRLKSWTQLMGYVLNPEDLQNGSKRIMRKSVKGETEEMIFIKTSKFNEKENLAF